MGFLLGLFLLLLVIGVILTAIGVLVKDIPGMVQIISYLVFTCLGLMGAIWVVAVLGLSIYLMTGNIPGMP